MDNWRNYNHSTNEILILFFTKFVAKLLKCFRNYIDMNMKDMKVVLSSAFLHSIYLFKSTGLWKHWSLSQWREPYANLGWVQCTLLQMEAMLPAWIYLSRRVLMLTVFSVTMFPTTMVTWGRQHCILQCVMVISHVPRCCWRPGQSLTLTHCSVSS